MERATICEWKVGWIKITSEAETVEENTSRMIAMSIVVELLTLATLPSGATKVCSGEVDGLVSAYPLGPLINQFKRKVAHPSNKG